MQPDASDLLRECLRIRRAEEQIVANYHLDLIQSPVHLSIGQEAVAVGVCSCMEPGDLIYANYRSHAYYLAKGGSLRGFFAELCGREGGCSGAKGGSMHLSAPEVGFMGTSAIVASSLPNAAGSALLQRNQGNGRLTVAVIGDGATEEGVYHETMNFAGLQSLPLLVVIEDNGLAVHIGKHERQSYSIRDHVLTYGVRVIETGPAHSPSAVAECVEVATREVREGVPHVILTETFRGLEHVGVNEDFDAGYRQEEAWRDWQAADWSSDTWPTRDFDEATIREEIDEAWAWALDQPLADTSQLLEDVY